MIHEALIGGAFSLIGGRRRNRAQMRMAREQMRFQERMSSTAFQRQTKDLERAGLNRILGLSGQGASSPSGAMAQIQDIVTPAVNTAIAARRASQEIKNLRAQEKLTTAQADVLQGPAQIGTATGKFLEGIKRKYEGRTPLNQMDYSSMWDQIKRDLGFQPSTAKSVKRKSPLELTIPGYARDLKNKHRKRKPTRNK